VNPPERPPLSIEMVPAPLWGRNLRDRLTRTEWNRLRRWALDRAGNSCQVCGLHVDGGRNLVCHEQWRYEPDGEGWTQRLMDVAIHCRQCDGPTHIGRLHQFGMIAVAPALRHLAAVNGWTHAKTMTHYLEAKRRWQQLSAIPAERWNQDLTWYDLWQQAHDTDA
jgi:hypothetical protein